MNSIKSKNLEWKIIIYVIILTIIGLIALYSASTSTEFEEFKKQLIWIGIGIPILIFMTVIDYKILARFSIWFYGVAIGLLIIVLFMPRINGARSWFVFGQTTLQPGEFAKVAVILFLSSTISNLVKSQEKAINKPLNILKIIGIVLLPVALIAIEPDYGTAMGYIFALVFILFVAGIDKRYIIVAITLVVILLPLLYFFVLPEHAKTRIDVYLNPYTDPRGDGYNIIQSEIAIGAGQLIGLGFLKGTQTHLGYLYPKTTDFIYSVIGEEFGFITCSIIVVLYVLLITKCINVGKNASDDLGSFLAIGLSRSFIFSCA